MRVVNLEEIRVALRTHHAQLGYVRLAYRQEGTTSEEQLQRWERDTLRSGAFDALGLADDAEEDDSVIESMADDLADAIRDKIETYCAILRPARNVESRFVARFMASKGSKTLGTVQLIAYSEDGDTTSTDIMRRLDERSAQTDTPSATPAADPPDADKPFDLDQALMSWWRRIGARSRNPVQQTLDYSVEVIEAARITSAYTQEQYMKLISQKDRRISALEKQVENFQNARTRQQNERDKDFETRAKEEREARQRWDFANKSMERLESVARDVFGLAQVADLMPLLESLTPDFRALLAREETRNMLKDPNSQQVLRALIERALLSRRQAAAEEAAANLPDPPNPNPNPTGEETTHGQ